MSHVSSPPEPSSVEPTPQQRRAMFDAIVQSVASAPGYLAFTNGLILLYLTAQGVSSERIVIYLAMPALAQAALMVPLAHLADHVGKRFIGSIGIGLELAGFITISASASMPHVEAFTFAGISAHAVGSALYTCSWFALLSPIVPETMRGRFFGRMRLSYQIFCIFFAIGCAMLLTEQTDLGIFQGMLLSITALLVLRIIFYVRLPELEDDRDRRKLLDALMDVMRAEGFMSFCAYVFVLMLFTSAVPTLFGLIEKRVLGWGDDRILWMGTLYMVGAVAGFAFGGRMVDRFTTKPVFMLCHFGYGAIMIAFLSRIGPPPVTLAIVGAANFLFGMVWAASSIAISTELLALIPAASKSLSTSLCMALHRAGAALSGIMVTVALKLGVLSDTWYFAGVQLSRYDTILLGCGAMVVVMVVTLGLVPSVIRKAEWIPRQT